MMAKSVRDLPENSYYDFKRTNLLNKIEPSTAAEKGVHDPSAVR